MVKKIVLVVTLISNGANFMCFGYFQKARRNNYEMLPRTSYEFYHYVRSVVKQGGDVNEPVRIVHNRTSTLLHHAARLGYVDSAFYLLNHGAHVNGLDSAQQTPLHLATDGGHVAMVQLLVGRQADVNAADNNNSTSLHNACEHMIMQTSPIIAQMLIQAGADVNAQDSEGITPLELAITASEENEGGVFAMAQLLLDAGANALKVYNDNHTSLHSAVNISKPEVLAFLLKKVNNPNIQDGEGNTLLHKACALRDQEKILLLLVHGADKTLQNNDGQIPLMVFLQGNGISPLNTRYISDAEFLESAFIDADTDVNVYDTQGNTLVHYGACCDNPHFMILAPLLRVAGHLINARNRYGQTPLYHAVASGSVLTTMMLLRAGADVTARDESGCTLLGRAIISKDLNRTTKLALAHLLMIYNGIFQQSLGKIEPSGDVHLSALSESNLAYCGIDKDFVKEALSTEGLESARQVVLNAYGQQECHMKRAPIIMRTLQRRELTGRWHPHA